MITSASICSIVPLSRLLPSVRPVLIQLFSLIAMIIIAYQLTEFAIEAQQNDRITVVLEWPLAVVAFAIAGLSCLSLLAQILGLVSRSSTGYQR